MRLRGRVVRRLDRAEDLRPAEALDKTRNAAARLACRDAEGDVGPRDEAMQAVGSTREKRLFVGRVEPQDGERFLVGFHQAGDGPFRPGKVGEGLEERQADN